jgi:uncharacterized protein (DUF58 family)
MMTRTGTGVALAGIVLVAGGALAGLKDFVLVGAGCLAGLALAALWVTATVADLVVRREVVPARMQEGQGAQGTLHIVNRRHRSSPPLAAVEVYDGQPVEVPIPPIGPRDTRQVKYDIPPLRRGQHDVQPLRIGQSDPFHLLLRASSQCEPLNLIVHPRVVPLEALLSAGPIDADGPVTSSNVTPGEEFRSLRPYEAGDDPRTVHWRSTARLGTLTVRVNVVPDQPRYTVLLDTSRSPYAGDEFDEAVRIAASVCTMAITAGFPLRVTTTADSGTESGITVHPARASAGPGKVRALDMLAVVSPSPADPGLAALDKRLAGSGGGVLVVITGRVGAQSLVHLPQARRRHLITVLVRVGDERRPETDPMRVRVITPRNAEQFAVLWDAVGRP